MRQGITVRWACGVFGLVLSACGVAAGDTAYEVEWIRQLGTSGTDYGHGVAVDGAGNVFISGSTDGNLDGINAGGTDAFLAKYNSAGNLLWTRQLGTSTTDAALSIAVDSAGNAFISGFTGGDLGGTNAGYDDAFLTKYNSDGNLQWTQQLGTSTTDWAHSVAVDGAGNAFISGFTVGNLSGTNVGGGRRRIPGQVQLGW